MARRILHRSEKEIIRILFHEARPVSIHELASLSGMSWVTARKYLDSCLEMNIIIKQSTEKNSTYILSKTLLRTLYNRKRKRDED